MSVENGTMYFKFTLQHFLLCFQSKCCMGGNKIRYIINSFKSNGKNPNLYQAIVRLTSPLFRDKKLLAFPRHNNIIILSLSGYLVLISCNCLVLISKSSGLEYIICYLLHIFFSNDGGTLWVLSKDQIMQKESSGEKKPEKSLKGILRLLYMIILFIIHSKFKIFIRL